MTPDPLYDAAIIGAGPAGAISAALLAQRAWRVLLVEKKTWPREKACGGCLNAAALRMLHDAGLAQSLTNSIPLTRFAVHQQKLTLAIPIPTGAAVPRSTFDAHLVQTAIARGAHFIPECSARLSPATHEPFRNLLLTRSGNHYPIKARIVLACDGLRGSLLQDEPWATWQPTPDSWIGISATIPHADIPPATISMFVGTGGYVGLVHLANNRIHIGAALDPLLCNKSHGATHLVSNILAPHGHNLPPNNLADFTGTPPLTGRRRAVGGYRTLAIGDACGYVEPFTGEGISWAIRGALAAVKLLPQDATQWPRQLPQAWNQHHQQLIARRQICCRFISQLLRHPPAISACMHAAHCLPWLPHMLAQRISA